MQDLIPVENHYNVILFVVEVILLVVAVLMVTTTTVSALVYPTSDFTANETLVCTYDVIQFTDTSTSFGTITGWWWLFGDSQDSHSQNPTHYYDTAGVYDVSLWVQDEWGEDTEIKVGYITVTGCYTGDFSANVTCQIGKPLGVQFDSSCDPAAKSYWWFGDGNTSDSYNPSHLYVDYGSYNVTFACNDISTGMATLVSKEDYIKVGVNGTYCSCNSTNNCCTSIAIKRDGSEILLFIGAFIIIVVMGIAVQRRKK